MVPNLLGLLGGVLLLLYKRVDRHLWRAEQYCFVCELLCSTTSRAQNSVQWKIRPWNHTEFLLCHSYVHILDLLMPLVVSCSHRMLQRGYFGLLLAGEVSVNQSKKSFLLTTVNPTGVN